MRVGVVSFPGTTDAEAVAQAVTTAGGEVVTLDETSESLDGVDAVVLPGGASYDDHLRPGALARLTPVVGLVVAAAREGLPVLGIGNGFQILCEARLLPGALTANASRSVVTGPQQLHVVTRDTVWTNQFDAGETITLELRSVAGAYVATTEALAQLESSDQIVFRYVGENPTGSAAGIAGITNERGNVVGIMAHPEQTATPDGQRFFTSLATFLDIVSTPR